MALFDIFKSKKGKKKEEARDVRYREKKKEKAQDQSAEKETEEKKAAKQETKTFASDRASRTLVHPIVTEKSARLSERGAYTFRVENGATKNEVRKAVEELYRVHVEQVNVVTVKPKSRILRGVHGTKSGHRKATVSLKEGEKIEFV